MGQLLDRANALLTDLESALQVENARHEAQVAIIARQKSEIEATLPLITDRLETALERLQRLGFLKAL